MKKEKDTRRFFLKHLAAGAAVVAGSVAAIRPARAKKAAPQADTGDVCYRESEDFRKYYRSLK